MKKLISLVAIAAFMLAMAGCAVNANTGAITVANNTDKAVSGAKIGTVTVGYIGAGQVTTVYFSKEETAAKIDFKGFEPTVSTKAGTIDLKKNFLYDFTLAKEDGKYIYSGNGKALNYDNVTSPTSDIIFEK